LGQSRADFEGRRSSSPPIFDLGWPSFPHTCLLRDIGPFMAVCSCKYWGYPPIPADDQFNHRNPVFYRRRPLGGQVAIQPFAGPRAARGMGVASFPDGSGPFRVFYLEQFLDISGLKNQAPRCQNP
jgi:hypothetical protein